MDDVHYETERPVPKAKKSRKKVIPPADTI